MTTCGYTIKRSIKSLEPAIEDIIKRAFPIIRKETTELVLYRSAVISFGRWTNDADFFPFYAFYNEIIKKFRINGTLRNKLFLTMIQSSLDHFISIICPNAVKRVTNYFFIFVYFLIWYSLNCLVTITNNLIGYLWKLNGNLFFAGYLHFKC